MLLDDVIARQPGEVEPVAQLPFHVAPARLRGLVPEAAGVVGALQGDDVADGAVVDALHRLALGVLVAAAQAGDDRQVLLLGLAARVQDRADAGRVDGDRLLAEDVLAGLDGRLEVHGRKCGGVAAAPRRRRWRGPACRRRSRRSSGRASRRPCRRSRRRCAGCSRLAWRRSAKASPMATSLTLGSACRACAAAPVPRPPQPIRPMRSVSLPAAWTSGAEPRATAPAAAAARNSRRDAPGGAEEGVCFKGGSPRRRGAIVEGENVGIPRRRAPCHHDPRRRRRRLQRAACPPIRREKIAQRPPALTFHSVHRIII